MKKAEILTPVITVFDKDGNVDMNGMKTVYAHLLEGGVDGIVLLGSSGEFYAIPDDQKKQLIKETIDYVAGKAKVYIGTSEMTVEETVALSNFTLDAGADAVMIISPYYFTLSQESIEYYYDQVASQIHGDIFLYNYPDRTVHDLSPEVTLNLLRKHKNIVGYKDSVAEFGHTRKVLTTVKNEFPDFMVYSGFDENMVHNVLAGGCGCIGGISNLYPEIFAEWVKAINDHDMAGIEKGQNKVDKLMDLYEVGQPFMSAMKAAMAQVRGIKIGEYSSKPLLQVSEAQLAKIKEITAAVEAM